MTRTLFIVTGIVLGALAVAVPALGKGQAGRDPHDAVAYFYANERATLAAQPIARPGIGDSHGRTATAVSGGLSVSQMMAEDGFDQAVAQANVRGLTTRLDYRDAFERSNPGPSIGSTPAGSGSEPEWPQLGIGFAIGIVLALGVLLAVRATRVRSLAH
jgi:hypothetical protein